MAMECPDTGRQGVRYMEITLKKENRAATHTSSSSTARRVDPVVWNEGWYRIVLAYKLRIPPAEANILKGCLPADLLASGDAESKQALAPLFMKAVKNPAADTADALQPWYQPAQRVGENTLAKLMADAAVRLNIPGAITNGSGRATLCRNVVQTGLPDSITMCFTRHKSVKALQAYTVRNNNPAMEQVSEAILGRFLPPPAADPAALPAGDLAEDLSRAIVLSQPQKAAANKENWTPASVGHPQPLLFSRQAVTACTPAAPARPPRAPLSDCPITPLDICGGGGDTPATFAFKKPAARTSAASYSSSSSGQTLMSAPAGHLAVATRPPLIASPATPDLPEGGDNRQ
jgi:hypothetical protein